MLAHEYDLHPLAVEDVLHFQRIKAVTYSGGGVCQGFGFFGGGEGSAGIEVLTSVGFCLGLVSRCLRLW